MRRNRFHLKFLAKRRCENRICCLSCYHYSACKKFRAGVGSVSFYHKRCIPVLPCNFTPGLHKYFPIAKTFTGYFDTLITKWSPKIIYHRLGYIPPIKIGISVSQVKPPAIPGLTGAYKQILVAKLLLHFFLAFIAYLPLNDNTILHKVPAGFLVFFFAGGK